MSFASEYYNNYLSTQSLSTAKVRFCESKARTSDNPMQYRRFRSYKVIIFTLAHAPTICGQQGEGAKACVSLRTIFVIQWHRNIYPSAHIDHKTLYFNSIDDGGGIFSPPDCEKRAKALFSNRETRSSIRSRRSPCFFNSSPCNINCSLCRRIADKRSPNSILSDRGTATRFAGIRLLAESDIFPSPNMDVSHFPLAFALLINSAGTGRRPFSTWEIKPCVQPK